jgi:hypothetical protein
MKPFAMPRGAAACAAALEPTPVTRPSQARPGRARSGGRGPRRPPVAAQRADAPAVSLQQQRNWSRRARSWRVRRDIGPGGIAANA